jgi:hypothetical protein
MEETIRTATGKNFILRDHTGKPVGVVNKADILSCQVVADTETILTKGSGYDGNEYEMSSYGGSTQAGGSLSDFFAEVTFSYDFIDISVPKSLVPSTR